MSDGLADKFDRLIARLERAMRQKDADRAWEELSRFAVENATEIRVGLQAIDDWRAAQKKVSHV